MSIFDCDSVGELRTSSFYAHFCAALRYARNRDVERKKTDQRDADTRDSLAALARRRSNSSPIVLQSDVQAAPQEKQEKQEKQSEAGSALQTGEDANDDANRAEESQTVKEKDAADGPDNTQQPQMA